MTGFKKFLLQGDLVSLAVAVIIAGVFGDVVKAFVQIIMDIIGKAGGTPNFSNYTPGGVHVGVFLTALITFIIVAAVVYFLVVMPYTRAKDRWFPEPEVEEGATVESLLTDIKELLATRQ